jgi:hypothetical protein
MLQYRLYGGKDLPAGLQGFLKGMLFLTKGNFAQQRDRSGREHWKRHWAVSVW